MALLAVVNTSFAIEKHIPAMHTVASLLNREGRADAPPKRSPKKLNVCLGFLFQIILTCKVSPKIRGDGRSIVVMVLGVPAKGAVRLSLQKLQWVVNESYDT